MARAGERILDSGDAFPEMTLELVGGGTMKLPDGVRGRWSILIVYRGDW
jgi:peroxiredoxin